MASAAADPAAPLLAAHGVEAQVSSSFGDERLPDGMVAITGRKT